MTVFTDFREILPQIKRAYSSLFPLSTKASNLSFNKLQCAHPPQKQGNKTWDQILEIAQHSKQGQSFKDFRYSQCHILSQIMENLTVHYEPCKDITARVRT